MLDRIKELDTELFLYLNNLGTISWDSFWLFITNKFSAIPLYFLLLFLVYKKYKIRKTLVFLLFILLLIAVSDQTSQFFKYSIQRLRPCHNPNISDLVRLVKASCGGKFAYFSAHAANSTAIAVIFSLLLKNKWITSLLLIWAMLVGYSRVYIGVHFPLDVFTGVFFGALYAFIFYYISLHFLKKVKI